MGWIGLTGRLESTQQYSLDSKDMASEGIIK